MSSSSTSLSPARGWRSEQARYAALTRDRAAGDPELLEAKRKMRSGLWISRVEKLVAQAPPLTDEQREYIAALLRSGCGS